MAFAEQGDKAKPFADTVVALGVTLNVSSLHRGLVTIDNTTNRKAEICAAIENIITSGSLGKLEAFEVAGANAICLRTDFWTACKEGVGRDHEPRIWVDNIPDICRYG